MNPEAKRNAGIAFRPAIAADLQKVVALTAEHRNHLADWSPLWWRKSEGADAVHPMWLQYLIENAPGTMHVATMAGQVVGCMGVIDQDSQRFVDDVAVEDDSFWSEFAIAMTSYVEARPAFTCVASMDGPRAEALSAAGFTLASSYWVRAATDATYQLETLAPCTAVGARPAHTFGGAPFDPTVEGALAFTTNAGSLVGSPSITAPPVFDPGGTVTVLDYLEGREPERLLKTALGLAGGRGDALLCVVCGSGNERLAEALRATGFTRTVRNLSMGFCRGSSRIGWLVG